MESTQLMEFYRNVSNWPKSESEIASVAEKVCRLIGVPFSAIVDLSRGERVGMHFSETPGFSAAGVDAFKEYLLRQIASAGRSSALGRQIQLTDGSLSTPFHYLSFISLTGEFRLAQSGRETTTRRDFGWLAVGSVKALATKEEILLLSAAQRLAELAELSDLNERIRLSNQFLSIVSHELKTPLTSIYGMLQLEQRILKMKKDDTTAARSERQQIFLKLAIRQVERLNELIDGLLDVSRIQNGRFVVEPSDTDVAAILRELVSSRLGPIAQEAGVRLHLEQPDHMNAWVDPIRMEEVVTNLVMNAIRFSPEGGVVWIKLREMSGSMRLIVRDQGPSVPMEDRERIFQPFERAQRTSRLGGLGLGLFISRQIAQLHGGTVSLVESVPGKGNVFEADFPMRNVNLASA